MTTPTDQLRILDLFCGAGGAGYGYALALPESKVVGVDINPQPDYPFDFFQDDAIGVLADRDWLATFDLIHASPPCQASSNLTKGTNAGREYPQLIPQVRAALEASGVPFVIENVQGSDLRRDLTLCGEMFGLGVIRHRYFECSFPVTQPEHQPHRGRVRGWRHGQYFDGPYVAVYGEGGGKGSVSEWQQAMGIDWTNDRKAIAEAIPPAYTKCVGQQFMEATVMGVGWSVVDDDTGEEVASDMLYVEAEEYVDSWDNGSLRIVPAAEVKR